MHTQTDTHLPPVMHDRAVVVASVQVVCLHLSEVALSSCAEHKKKKNPNPNQVHNKENIHQSASCPAEASVAMLKTDLLHELTWLNVGVIDGHVSISV